MEAVTAEAVSTEAVSTEAVSTEVVSTEVVSEPAVGVALVGGEEVVGVTMAAGGATAVTTEATIRDCGLGATLITGMGTMIMAIIRMGILPIPAMATATLLTVSTIPHPWLDPAMLPSTEPTHRRRLQTTRFT